MGANIFNPRPLSVATTLNGRIGVDCKSPESKGVCIQLSGKHGVVVS